MTGVNSDTIENASNSSGNEGEFDPTDSQDATIQQLMGDLKSFTPKPTGSKQTANKRTTRGKTKAKITEAKTSQSKKSEAKKSETIPIMQLVHSINSLTGQITGLRNDVNKLQAEVKSSSEKLNSVISRVETIEHHNVARDQKISGLEERIAELEGGKHQRGCISKLELKMDEIEQKCYDTKLTLTTTDPIPSDESTPARKQICLSQKFPC